MSDKRNIVNQRRKKFLSKVSVEQMANFMSERGFDLSEVLAEKTESAKFPWDNVIVETTRAELWARGRAFLREVSRG
jgi:hypothetical protein